jgi:medium-chain acyl-[acyl-carrier-protein] hydrolase
MQELMKAQGMFEKQFELRYFEMNRYGEASPMTLLTLLEETASEHFISINYSLFDLIKQNIGWVLLSGVMNIDRYPRHKEKIIIRTWLSSYSAVKGIRENIICDESGNIIGRAKGLWLFYDIEKRRPVQIFDDIKTKWSYNSESSIDCDITKKIKAIDSAT